MSRNPLSLKQLQNSNSIEQSNIEMPKYVIKPLKFSCPISVSTLWHHNLVYKECPIAKNQRDMPECANCRFKVTKEKLTYQRRKGNEPVPNIKKTYVSQ